MERKTAEERRKQIYRTWTECVASGETPTLENIASRIGTVKSVVFHHMKKMVDEGTMVELAAGTDKSRWPDWVVAEAKERLADHAERLS